MIILAGIVPLAVGTVVYLVWRNGHITGDKAERWAASRGLTLTDENRGTVIDYLHTAGLLRGLGLLAGLVLPMMWSWALGATGPVIPPWTWAFLGYLTGALFAEISLRRPTGGSAAAAPRHLRSYIKPLLLRGQIVLGVLLVTAGLAAPFVPQGNWPVARPRLPALLAVVGGLIITLSLLAVERWLVLRPQPVLTPGQLAADDAIRSQSVQSIAASGMAVQLTLLALVLVPLNTAGGMWKVVALLGGLLHIVALWVCLEFGHLGWRVKRSFPISTVKAASC